MKTAPARVERVRNQTRQPDGTYAIVCLIVSPEPLREGDEIQVRVPASPCPLSGRPLEAVRELGKGLLYKQIAAEMGVTTSTVRTHLRNVYRLLDVPDRAQAVLLCQREGWI